MPSGKRGEGALQEGGSRSIPGEAMGSELGQRGRWASEQQEQQNVIFAEADKEGEGQRHPRIPA